MFRRTVGDRLVMSPMEPLVAGGAAEAFERHLQQPYRAGYRHLVAHLSGVPLEDLSVQLMLEGAGVKWLASEHTRRERA